MIILGMDELDQNVDQVLKIAVDPCSKFLEDYSLIVFLEPELVLMPVLLEINYVRSLWVDFNDNTYF